MMKWRRRASHLGRFTLWHNGPELHNSVDFCGTTATELLHANLLCVAQQPPSYKLGKFILWHNGRRATTQLGRFTLCGTTAAELHNSVDLLCGTTAAELHNSVDLLCSLRSRRFNHPLRVSLARVRSLFRPLLPSACYAGYLLCGTAAAETFER